MIPAFISSQLDYSNALLTSAWLNFRYSAYKRKSAFFYITPILAALHWLPFSKYCSSLTKLYMARRQRTSVNFLTWEASQICWVRPACCSRVWVKVKGRLSIFCPGTSALEVSILSADAIFTFKSCLIYFNSCTCFAFGQLFCKSLLYCLLSVWCFLSGACNFF